MKLFKEEKKQIAKLEKKLAKVNKHLREWDSVIESIMKLPPENWPSTEWHFKEQEKLFFKIMKLKTVISFLKESIRKRK